MALNRKSTTLANMDLSLQQYLCDCDLMKSIGLPCKHLFHRRLEMGLMLFDASLINDRWTLNYYRTLSVPRFSKDHTPEEENNLNDYKKTQVDVIEEKTAQNVLSQAKKFKKALQLSQEIAS